MKKIYKATYYGAEMEASKGLKFGQHRDFIWKDKFWRVHHTPAGDHMTCLSNSSPSMKLVNDVESGRARWNK
jgi:hypothetical protein